MELNDLKSDWKSATTHPTSADALRRMVQEGNHPVLRGIKWQLIIETVLFSVLLVGYYDGFDGDQKPLYVNVVLVLGVVLVLAHNVLGYLSARNLIVGADLRASIGNYLAQIKSYAIVSVLSRVAAFVCLMVFFLSTVDFSGNDLILTCSVLALIVAVQVFFLLQLWNKRIRSLEVLLNQFDES